MWQTNSGDANQCSALKFKGKFEERIPATLLFSSMTFLKTIAWHFTINQGCAVSVPVQGW